MKVMNNQYPKFTVTVVMLDFDSVKINDEVVYLESLLTPYQ